MSDAQTPTLEEFLACCDAECQFLVREYGFEPCRSISSSAVSTKPGIRASASTFFVLGYDPQYISRSIELHFKEFTRRGTARFLLPFSSTRAPSPAHSG